MKVIDPHIHMVSRTTDDYLAMACSGIHTVSEPAFWPGFDRSGVASFHDYFNQLTVTEPARAARFKIRHFCWIGMNAKEAENLSLSEEVLTILPQYLDRPTALGIGEVGLNKNSRNEIKVLERQVALAAERGELLLIHTPHLEDKLKGTRIIIELLRNEPRISPERVLIDHAEEHTIGMIRDYGAWFGMTLYPDSKGSPARAVDAVEIFGPQRLCINSSADWSVSDPLATLKTANEMRRRGYHEDLISTIFYHNPKEFLGQCPKFSVA
ncbi:TatD family hydrolase [Geomonas sp. RF6]|uniref:TatD family hydrolase n=1 Tax=Geomonas sp. RF6 TaxID=2897342 RepID=UPI001E2AEAD5|nr:TatD family hydrolase [Geomonas sp. RF6]UFS69561.1 TatD family hydrolase [Geomonas sp. RF6]